MRIVILLLVVALVRSQVVDTQNGDGPKKSATSDTQPNSAPATGGQQASPSPSAPAAPPKPARYSQHSADDPGLQQPDSISKMESPLFLGPQMEIQPDPAPPTVAGTDALTDSGQAPLNAEDEALVNKTETLLQKAEKLRFEGVTDDHGVLGAPDLVAAAAAYREAALLGSAEAVNALGELLLYGEGGKTPDFSLARFYFDKAAEAGLADAQHNRGFMYAVGLGFDPLIPQNESAAGLPPAMHAMPKPPEGDWEEEPVEEISPQELAQATTWLKQGRPGLVDEAKAVLNYYFASMNGSPRAQIALGYRHLIGHGVPKSCEAAIKYYTAVAEKVVHDITDEESPMIIERLRLADENTRAHSPSADADVIQYYQSFAEAGDMHAQFALGQLHFYGARGVPRDLQAAHRYFELAANQGDPPAMSNLGQMLIQGVGVTQNNETAVKWLREAAEQGEPSALNGLGFAYLHGRGVNQDYKEALKYFKQASDKGSADAQFNLGVLYFAGLGVEKNYGTALQYFTQASHAGHTRALFNLGQMHMNGFGTVPNCAIAVKFLKTVAERGPWATALADAHRAFIEGNFEQALLTYARSAEEGVEVAQANAAWMLDQGLGFPHSNARELAFHFYEHAAKQGNVDAQRMLGDYYYYGWAPASSTAPSTADDTAKAPPVASSEPLKLTGQPLSSAGFPDNATSKPDFEMAAQHYLVAANKNNAQAMFNLGYMHEHGIGLKQDFHLAQRYYDQSLSADVDAFVPVRLALLKLWVHRVLFHYAPWTLQHLERLHASSSALIFPYVHSLDTELRVSGPPATGEGQWHPVHPDGHAQQSLRAWVAGVTRSFEKHLHQHGTVSDVIEDVILYVLLGLLAVLVFLRSRPR